MKKFVVNKGKKGYDFATLADSEVACIDLAFDKRCDDIDTESIRMVEQCVGPFVWWETCKKRWGNDKWYVVELSINEATKDGSSMKNPEVDIGI